MRNKRFVIFAGAKINDYSVCWEYMAEADTVICCDSGMHHTKAMGITPDFIVGDFDSVNPTVLEEYRKMGIEVHQYPAHKDQTDMQIGIELALDKGAEELFIFGGIGSRLDHTLANAQLLYGLLKKGVRARLINENNYVELIDKELVLEKGRWDFVSLVPLSMEVLGITLTGFSYPLNEYDLQIDDEILAVSNEIIEDVAKISIKSGYAFVICAND